MYRRLLWFLRPHWWRMAGNILSNISSGFGDLDRARLQIMGAQEPPKIMVPNTNGLYFRNKTNEPVFICILFFTPENLTRLRELALHSVRERKNRLMTLETRLRLLGPEQVLSRGYSITMDAKTGRVLRQAS